MWITAPAARTADARKAPIALQFRRAFWLARRPSRLRVGVSADQRFSLYLNGRLVGEGPARGDLGHWRSESLDLAPFLRAGSNVLAAEVWSDGGLAPLAQITSGTTAFRLEADGAAFASRLESGPRWSVRVDPSRTVSSGMSQLAAQVGKTFYAAGPPETVLAAREASDWLAPRSRAQGWGAAVAAVQGAAPWTLVPDPLPAMRRQRVASGRVVKTLGPVQGSLTDGGAVIPANAEATILVDAGRVLAAFPRLDVAGGAGSDVQLTYAEALYDRPGPQAGGDPLRLHDRAAVTGGFALGLTDTFRPDGRDGQVFQPFWWRAWRFLQIKVRTGSTPLRLTRLTTAETGYPFEQKGWFRSDDDQLNAIWAIGWRTALFDAHETYMDTAYWEQLQYIGDTRLQMLLSYDVAGDPRLAVQALDAFDHSAESKGEPQAAYPERNDNFIPPFGLLWVGAVHDFWMYRSDPAVLTRSLPGIRKVLDWYDRYLTPEGLVGPTPGWRFIDWREELDGLHGQDGDPNRCVISLLYLGALREAADLEGAAGAPARAEVDEERAGRLATAVNAQCWDAERGLYADSPAKTRFSQHANALAVLYDVAPLARRQAILLSVTTPNGIDPPDGVLGATYYFSFYLAQALDHAGLSDRYVMLLDSWRKLLDQHFTTWPEQPDPSRSDSHAWSAHPTAGLLTYVAGIRPAAPGFGEVLIAPSLGRLSEVDAAMASPRGLIRVTYHRHGHQLTGSVVLPDTLKGRFVWQGHGLDLHSGNNPLRLDASG